MHTEISEQTQVYSGNVTSETFHITIKNKKHKKGCVSKLSFLSNQSAKSHRSV